MKLSILFSCIVGSSAFLAPSVVPPRQSLLLTLQEARRRPFISGNWKLNPQTRDEAVKLASDIAASITPNSPPADVALFVPYVFIDSAMAASNGKLQVGAEVL